MGVTRKTARALRRWLSKLLRADGYMMVEGYLPRLHLCFVSLTLDKLAGGVLTDPPGVCRKWHYDCAESGTICCPDCSHYSGKQEPFFF